MKHNIIIFIIITLLILWVGKLFGEFRYSKENEFVQKFGAKPCTYFEEPQCLEYGEDKQCGERFCVTLESCKKWSCIYTR